MKNFPYRGFAIRRMDAGLEGRRRSCACRVADQLYLADVCPTQDMRWEKEGAFTGEINAAMLEALQVKHVVIGYSERRQWFGESDAMVDKKVAAVLQVGLNLILCIGKTLAERDGNRMQEIL